MKFSCKITAKALVRNGWCLFFGEKRKVLQSKPPKRWTGAAWPQLNVVTPRVSKPWKCVLQNGRDRNEKVTFTNLLYKGKIGYILNTEGVFEYRDDIFAAAYKRAVFG